MFEAPTKDLQVEIDPGRRPDGQPGEHRRHRTVVGVETLRRGLRGDTLLDLTTGAVPGSLRPVRSARPPEDRAPRARRTRLARAHLSHLIEGTSHA